MNAELLEPILASPHLPTLPAVATRLVALAPRDDVTIDEIASIISSDPALAVKLLKTANSALYARSRPARTVREAVLLLGLRSVRALALSFSLVDDQRQHSTTHFDYDRFWAHSIAAACVARTLAGFAGSWCREEAFLGGLLHGVGILALARSDCANYAKVFGHAAGDRARLRELEEEAYGFGHPALGAALAERWTLPSELVTGIREHLDPGVVGEGWRQYARVVGAAAIGADALVGGENPSTHLQRFRSICNDWWGSPPTEADSLLAHASDDASVTRTLLGVHASSTFSSLEILALANDELARLHLQSVEAAVKLEDENLELWTAATLDPLTGIANRRYYDEFLGTQLRLAAERQSPLTLFMIDVDHFKLVNDTFGHQAGDGILVAAASILQQSVRKTDLVARLGGEEFAVILPGTGHAGGLEVAERIRRTVEAATMRDKKGHEVRVTVSVGVASYNWSARQTAMELLTEADAALYRAKRAGRNRVAAANPEVAA